MGGLLMLKVRTKFVNYYPPPQTELGGGVIGNHLVHLSIFLSVCAIVTGPNLSHGKTLEVPTLQNDCL